MPDSVVQLDRDPPKPVRLYLAHCRAVKPEPTDPFAFHDAIRTVEAEIYGAQADKS